MCPFYKYSCECGYEDEKLEIISKNKKLYPCPKCKSKTLIRHCGMTTNVIFKGNGWFSKQES